MSINQQQPPTQPKIAKTSSFVVPVPRSGQSLLGITTEFASTRMNASVETSTTSIEDSVASKLDNNVKRYALQKIAKKYHPESRITACMRSVLTDAEHIELHYNDTERHAHYRNIMRCDNVWLCPVCSARMTSNRAEEIKQAYEYALASGLRVFMVTYTMSHHEFDDLSLTVDAMREARRKMRSGRKWQNFKANYGYVGCISSLEVTYGMDFGWHPHVHEIVFLDPKKAEFELHEDDRKLQSWLNDELSQWWVDSLDKVDRKATVANGLDVRTAKTDISKYVAKYGKWNIALELAKSMFKTGGESYHPFEILEMSDNPHIEESKRKKWFALWHEYAEAFSGKAQIYWTDGLKDLLLVEEISTETEDDTPTISVMYLSRGVWHEICANHKHAEVLNNAILWRGDHDKMNRYLKRLCDESRLRRKCAEHWKKPAVKEEMQKHRAGTIWDYKANKIKLDG